MEVHPAAAVWPMLPDDELAELADSIEQVGLLEPLVRTPDGLLLDGRNRLAACERAGVEPTWAEYDGDPAAYVVARNAARRHMTTGQRAMAVAMVLDADGKRQNGRWAYGALATAESNGAVALAGWQQRLREAGLVLDHAPDQAPLVVSAATTLAEAHAKAKAEAKKADTDQARLAALTEAEPDLAAQVREETLKLVEAEAAAKARAAARAQARRDAAKAASQIATSFTTDVLAIIGGIEAGYPPELPDGDLEQLHTSMALLLERLADDDA